MLVRSSGVELLRTTPSAQSGVAPIDERLGGLTDGRPHLLTGSPGSGKTSVCLRFIATALASERSAALLTADDPAFVVAHAADLGIDLLAAGAAGRFTLVRYGRDFGARFERLLSAEPVIHELVATLGTQASDRLVVDSVAPFLDCGSAAGSGVAALGDALDRLRCTTLVTYPGDVRERYDRRLEPLVRRCAAVLHLSAYGEGIGRMELVKARARLWSDAPSYFRIRPGLGVIPLEEDSGATDPAQRATIRPQLLIVGADGVPDDLLAALMASFVVTVHDGPLTVMPESMGRDVGAVVIAARWDTIHDAAMLLWELRASGNRTPAILITRGDVRSSDRARAMLAGFDDVLGHGAGTTELTARVTAAIRRGRSAPLAFAIPDAAHTVTMRATASAPVLDEMQFRSAVVGAAHESGDRLFGVLLLHPAEHELDALDALAALVARTVRAANGDRVGVIGKRVAVYLPGTRRLEASHVVRRIGDEWLNDGHEPLRVVQRTHPADRDLLRADLRPSTPAPRTVYTP